MLVLSYLPLDDEIVPERFIIYMHIGQKLVQRLLFNVDTNMASNNPRIGPLYPDIATVDLTDEGVKADIISKSDPSWALSFQFPSR